jgi:hypothetical protein
VTLFQIEPRMPPSSMTSPKSPTTSESGSTYSVLVGRDLAVLKVLAGEPRCARQPAPADPVGSLAVLSTMAPVLVSQRGTAVVVPTSHGNATTPHTRTCRSAATSTPTLSGRSSSRRAGYLTANVVAPSSWPFTRIVTR